MDETQLQLIVTFFTEGFMKDLMMWILGIFAFWGLTDLYMMLRMRKNGYIDKTAALWNWFNLKWALASRAEIVAEKLPFLKQDLTEVIGVKPDDGKVS